MKYTVNSELLICDLLMTFNSLIGICEGNKFNPCRAFLMTYNHADGRASKIKTDL